MTVALQCQSLSVRYGRFTAVDDFTYAFEQGRLYGIIGPNGAGKTTLMNVIVGGKRPSAGSVSLAGRDVTALAVPARSRLGLGRSFQISKIFAGMSVFENLRLAAQASVFGLQPIWKPARDYPAIAEKARAMLETVGLAPYADIDAEKLSHGDQRALELGLALMTAPSVLLLDEPLAGVGQHGLSAAIDLLARVAAGRTVLLIEHNMNAVMRLAEQVLVMADGKLIASGQPEVVRRDPLVRDAYLGSDA